MNPYVSFKLSAWTSNWLYFDSSVRSMNQKHWYLCSDPHTLHFSFNCGLNEPCNLWSLSLEALYLKVLKGHWPWLIYQLLHTSTQYTQLLVVLQKSSPASCSCYSWPVLKGVCYFMYTCDMCALIKISGWFTCTSQCLTKHAGSQHTFLLVFSTPTWHFCPVY